MTDFLQAFKAGQNAAENAENSRKEIDQIFLELKQQILDATEGKVEILRDQFIKRDAVNLATSLGFNRERYWAIAARNPLADETLGSVQLALWDQNKSGYPCRITLDGTDRYFSDRQSLEQGLAWLLEDSGVGEKLKKLMAQVNVNK